MYRTNKQMRIDDFIFTYGTLNPENEWVKLAALGPWEVAEDEYAKQFVNNGHSAHSVRIALGALIIKQRLKCTDEWTVRHVSENLYLQFFLGLKEYTNQCSFGSSTMVEFRKWFPPGTIKAILAASVPSTKTDDEGDDSIQAYFALGSSRNISNASNSISTSTYCLTSASAFFFHIWEPSSL